MNDTATPVEVAPAQQPLDAAPPLPVSQAARFLAVLALFLALLALALLAWHWYASRAAVESLRQEVARKIAIAETLNQESRLIAEQSREASTDAQVKLGVLESRFAETQSQQIALESLYQELSRGRDDWAFAEIEQSLLIASQQLQLAGNVKAALIALESADARLQRMQQPQLIALRKALNTDIERLKALPFVDTVGVSLKLDNVIATVDALPLAMEVRPQVDPAAQVPATAAGAGWQRLLSEAWAELKQLVRVQRVDQPAVPLLAPAHSYFLRENLKLRLLGARLAVLVRDQVSYRADLQAAREWLTRYYDTRERSVASALATLRNLHGSDIDIDLPDMSATLDALRALRLARERPLR
jgi:uroporphyrin-III C-methyltransferase